MAAFCLSLQVISLYFWPLGCAVSFALREKKKEIYIYVCVCVCVLQYGKIYKHIVGHQAIKQVTNSIHWASQVAQ